MPDEIQNVVEPEATDVAAEMTAEEEEKGRKRKAAARTRKWRESHPNYSPNYYKLHRSQAAREKEATAIEEFWQGVEQLRNWTESLFDFKAAEYQFMATVLAVLLADCVKYVDGKPNAIGSEEDFVAISGDIEDFTSAWFFLAEGLARKTKRTERTSPPQRGPRIVSEWSALMEAGLIGEYLGKVQAKLQSLGYPIGPDPDMNHETNIVHYLIDPLNRCSDFASLLVEKAKQCVYKPCKGSTVDCTELSSKEAREVLRELEIVTPAVVDALIDQAPNITRETGLPANEDLFRYGPPFLLAAARWDMTPAFYNKIRGALEEQSRKRQAESPAAT